MVIHDNKPPMSTTKRARVQVRKTQPVKPAEPIVVETPKEAPKEASTKPAKLQLTVIPESRIKGQLLEATSGSILREAGDRKAELGLLKEARAALESGKISEIIVSVLPLPEGSAPDAKAETKRETVERPITDAERAGFEQTVAQLSPIESRNEDLLQALKNERTRLAEDAVVALTITVEETLRQIMGHTVAQTFDDGLKTLMVEHIHRGGIENLELYPLFKNLPSFAQEAARHRSAAQEAAWNSKAKALVNQAERDFKKKYKLPPKSVAKPVEAPKEAPKPVEVPAEEPAEVDGPTSIHFIKKLFDDMSEREPTYKAARVSKPYKQYLAQLANELVSYLAPLIALVAGTMKTKTVSKAAVLCVVKMLLVAGRPTSDTFELDTVLCDDNEFVKVEAAKKKADPAYVKLEAPKVNKLVARHSLGFPGNAFDSLEKTIDDKLHQKHVKKEASA